MAAGYPTFSAAAGRLLDNGYRPLPVPPSTKAPILKGWQRFCRSEPAMTTIEEWARRFPDWSTGAATGGLVAIDIDILDQTEADRMRRSAVEAFGDTPLVRIGRAPKLMMFYRAQAPFQHFKVGQVEVLSLGRQAMLFGMHPDTGEPYRWINETPLDVPLSALPQLSEADARAWLVTTPARDKGERNRTLSVVDEPIDKGERNRTLFAEALRASSRVASCEDLICGLQRLNEAACAEPLAAKEVERVARSAWRYHDAGIAWPEDGERRAVITESELDKYQDAPDALVLLVFLRLRHGQGASSVAISPGAMAGAKLIGDWSKQRYATARDALKFRGGIQLEKEGTGRGNASLYRLVAPAPPVALKGIKSCPNVIIHTLAPFTEVGGELAAGAKLDPTGPEIPVLPPQVVNFALKGERHGKRPPPVRGYPAQSDLITLLGSPPPKSLIEDLRHRLRMLIERSPRGTKSKIAKLLGMKPCSIRNFLVQGDGLNKPALHMLKQILDERLPA